MKIKYINIIDFMLYDLELKGNELLLYALIYWYTQDGKNVYHWSLNYIAKWLNISRRNAIDILKKLQDKQLIIKQEESNYIINTEKIASAESSLGGEENAPVASAESSPNIYNNINNNIYKKKNIKEKENIAIEILDYYINKIENIWLYNRKYHKKKLSIERINNALKKYTKEQIINYIDNYIIKERENIQKWYCKMAQYFFWYVERWSKILFFEEYQEIDKQEQKERKEVNINDFI